MLLASSADHPATLWDPQLKSELGHLDAIIEPINNACWCGPNLAITDSRFEIHLHTAMLESQDKAELHHMRTWSGHSDCVVDIDWAPNQWLLASCSEDRTVRLWGTHQVLISHLVVMSLLISLLGQQSCLDLVLTNVFVLEAFQGNNTRLFAVLLVSLMGHQSSAAKPCT